MKKRFTKIFISCLVLCLCMALAAPAAFADGETTYVVSFRPGEHGSFSADALGYLSGYGEAEMSATGNLFVRVTSGTSFPAGVLSYLGADEGYYYRDGFVGDVITEDATYVAQFGILSSDAARYTVRYVDSVSGTELAESYTGYANVGDVIPFAAKSVTGYDVDSPTKSITVYDGAELTFYYTSNGTLDEIQYEYGQDTVITQTVTTPDNNNNNDNDNEPNDNNENAENVPVVMVEGEVPLAGGESEGAQPVEIEDPEVPLAGPDMKDEISSGNVIGVAIAAIVIVLLALVAALLLSRKKKETDKE